MANVGRRLPHNVDGDFFVDESCIDCDTCRWMAPETFVRRESQASVAAQPASPAQLQRALLALVSCPTASIGTTRRHDVRAAQAALPDPVTENVYHCGYHAESSFGAASYLVVREAGNVLVDSPRFAGPLVERLEALGGVATLFLTHKDDVADHDRFAAHFGCERILHRADRTAGTADVERWLEGEDAVALAPDLEAIPVPGHTRGSTCLRFDGRVLFTGDHLAWSDTFGRLHAFRGACWYSWDEQIRSMRRLLDVDFSWVLPGHGRRCRLPAPAMHEGLQTLIAWMESA